MTVKIAILGIGKMGAWLALELSKSNSVVLYDQDPQKTECFPNQQQLKSLSALKDFQPEFLINAVTLQNTKEVFQSALAYITKDCVLVDVASIKEGLGEFYASCGFRFVSLHPMFGPTFADMNALKEENVIIIKNSDSQGKEFFKSFFSGLGLHLFEYSFQEHDEMMAYSLTIPFVSSLVFAACVDNTAVPGSTFLKHRNIAQGLLGEDNALLSEVLFNPYSFSKLERITSRLEFLKHVIRARDYDEAKRFFDKLRKNI